MLKSATVSYNREAGQTKTAAMCDFFWSKRSEMNFFEFTWFKCKINKQIIFLNAVK